MPAKEPFPGGSGIPQDTAVGEQHRVTFARWYEACLSPTFYFSCFTHTQVYADTCDTLHKCTWGQSVKELHTLEKW